MKESLFIKRYARQWKEFERQIASKQIAKTDPDILAELFIRVTDDLSYAKTFYGNGKTTQYLNRLAQQLHQLIYSVKKERRGRIIEFWISDVPKAIYETRKQMIVSMVLFLIFTGVGAFSGAYDENFPRLILGDAYVDMTIDNIKRGDPMAVYSSSDSISMFFAIALNNIWVCLRLILSGFFLSVGTLLMLGYNAIMFGAFQYFFYEYHLLAKSASVIFIHGSIELSMIVVAGGAGLAMGNSWLFPGTYTRMHSFRHSAKNAVVIFFGIVPYIVLAALLESFVTRYDDMHVGLAATIILLSFLLVYWYFIHIPTKFNKELP